MQHITIRSLVLLFLIFTPVLAGAHRNVAGITYPYEVSFDTDINSDLYWNSGDGSHAWQATGGWGNSGCVKIVPGAANDSYYCLGQLENLPGDNTVIHARWLQYFGSSFADYQPACKNYDLWDYPPVSSKPLMHLWPWAEGDAGMVLGCSNNTYANFQEGYTSDGAATYYPNGGEFHVEDFENQWVCFEYVGDIANNLNILYVWTQDGTWSGEYNRTTNTTTGSYWVTIDFIGTYVNSGRTGVDENFYYMIDELIVSPEYIGPPTGFVTSSEPTGVTGISVTGCNFN